MSIRELTWRPESVHPHVLTWRDMKRRLQYRQRATKKYIYSQYYIHNALSDGIKAFLLNEDIALAGLIIIAIMSFATISIFANILFYFLMAASVLSNISSSNIVFWAAASLAVPLVLSLWICALIQNVFMFALYEGTTRKRYRSLRQTMRKSLRNASRTATAWIGLMSAAIAPAALSGVVFLGIVKVFDLGISDIAAYFIVLEFLALIWAAWVLLNYSLLPQVMLFMSPASWKDGAAQAKKLVSRKGRLFILATYLSSLIGLGTVYLLASGIHVVTETGTILNFLLLCMVPVTLMNMAFTMLYRKRRLARS